MGEGDGGWDGDGGGGRGDGGWDGGGDGADDALKIMKRHQTHLNSYKSCSNSPGVLKPTAQYSSGRSHLGLLPRSTFAIAVSLRN